MLIHTLHTAYAYICSLIVPPFCQGCSLFLSLETVFCDACWKRIQPVAPTIFPVTQSKSVIVYALGAYAFPLKQLILKKNNRAIAASALLGHAVWDKTIIQTLHFDYIVFVPLHWTRRCWRGFNQTEEMSMVISRLSKKKIIHALRRTKKTRFQTECSKAERADNVIGAFSATEDASLLKNKTVLLVDDLLTTGSTLSQAAKVLYKAGAHTVIAVAGAKAI